MAILDYAIFAFYMVGVLGIGIYYFLQNKSAEDYYVGSRNIKSHHVGMSVVATDVGGGFSIGLGGVGFAMGLAGSWLLFTGLVGAWLSAILIIPRLKKLDKKHEMMTFPDFLRHRYNGNVAMVASLISGIGYLGFSSAQLRAGATLASGTIIPEAPWGMDPIRFSLIMIAVITIVYTTLGGLKAVIYTDTIQWLILLVGLIFVTIPVTLYEIGGFSALWENLPHSHFSLLNISPATFINWMITVIPIWFVAMTLYQRIFACATEKDAKRAWYIAGLLEYPVMAFTGVFLGMCARVVFPEAESEMGLPMLIRDILPIGVTGIVIASYFSAIMSTADSCLMASSGNFVGDIGRKYLFPNISDQAEIRLSMLVTMILGVVAVFLAAQFTTVLDAILYAYAFMVAGLFIPTLGAYFWPRGSSTGAILGMVGGGVTTILLMTNVIALPGTLAELELDHTLYGILASSFFYIVGSYAFADSKEQGEFEISRKNAPDDVRRLNGPSGIEPILGTTGMENIMSQPTDMIETVDGAAIQHGTFNDRIYLQKIPATAGDTDVNGLVQKLTNLAEDQSYSKIFAKVRQRHAAPFLAAGFDEEGQIPNFYNGTEAASFLGWYQDKARRVEDDPDKLEEIIATAKNRRQTGEASKTEVIEKIYRLGPEHLDRMAEIYREVFPTYPFPIHKPDYLLETMQSHVAYFGIERDGQLVSLSSAEMDADSQNVEMTDFATLPDFRGNGFATQLLSTMEDFVQTEGIKTAYTIARAASFGMNIAFAKNGYDFAGRLINNTNISGQIESMNLWYKPLE